MTINEVMFDFDVFNTPEVSKISGLALASSLPPFYVPISATSIVDERNTLIIDLHYEEGTSEPTRNSNLTNGFIIAVGKKSGRVYSLQISMNSIELKGVPERNKEHKLINKISELIRREEKKSSFTDLGPIKNMFKRYGHEVLHLPS